MLCRTKDKIGENLGTGFPTMVDVWKKKFHTLPKLEENLQVNITELTFSGMKSVGEVETKSSPKSSPKTQGLIIALIKANPEITTEEMAAQLGLTKRAIIKNTNKMQTNGQIIHKGPNKGGHWEVLLKE